MKRLGVYGSIAPAKTDLPDARAALANCFASPSLSNDSVLRRRRRGEILSDETHQIFGLFISVL